MSKLYVNELAPKTSGNKIIMPQGGIIQMQYTQFTGTNTISCSANVDTQFNDLTVNITPTLSNSKLFIQAHVFGEHSVSADNGWNHMFFFYRNSTKLGAAAAGNRRTGVSMSTLTFYANDGSSTPDVARFDYFDEPNTTSQITYSVGLSCLTANNWHLNKTVSDTDSTSYERGTSYISVTEIAG